ncbi:SPX domain-containing protein [Cercophora newfieldiana]|uniref:SPX domain-containing protein n=1 Tax=Cercophora newfieldiana TaxID=92897 RepID=A0AA39YD51_9PEZI|nr:SPX domain-containing protein [Cercophora newfieldiana]
MKFGHAFQEALQAETYPQHWVDKAIPYRQLKKILGKVREELIRNGYDPDTLHRLLADHNAKYSLELGESHLLRPRLVVRPLSALPESWKGPETAAAVEEDDVSPKPVGTPVEASPPAKPETETVGTEAGGEGESSSSEDQQKHPWVKIPLDSDARFFNILQTDVGELDTLQSEERRALIDGISALGTEISEVARPRKGFIKVSKSDLYRWREIFELYLAAQVFFSTTETSGGVRSSERARKQLVWFQDEVSKRQLLSKFKLEASSNAYTRFLALNATLLQNVQFQELNQTAVVKIIKKFDKQTSLGAKTVFPKALHSASYIAESIAKDICAQLSNDVLAIVPQVADYTCTICLSICWLPIRLDCTHLFCIRCMIKMQNRNKKLCPLCRANTVLSATEFNIDVKLMGYLERWFPKETKEKQAYNELERRKELFGDAIGDETPGPPCVVM